MPKFRVHLVEETCGDVVVEAPTPQAAEEAALQSAAVDWCNESETHVCFVEPVEGDA